MRVSRVHGGHARRNFPSSPSLRPETSLSSQQLCQLGIERATAIRVKRSGRLDPAWRAPIVARIRTPHCCTTRLNARCARAVH